MQNRSLRSILDNVVDRLGQGGLTPLRITQHIDITSRNRIKILFLEAKCASFRLL